MPLRVCAEAGCASPATQRGRCQAHARQQARSKGPRIYDTKRWKLTRRRVLFEEPMCRNCVAQQLQVLAAEVDHINGDPMDNRRENLQPLCKPCHSAKTRLGQAA